MATEISSAGVAAAFFTRNDNSFVITGFSGDVVVAQLNLPSGTYIVHAKVEVAVPPFPLGKQIDCFLRPSLGSTATGDGDLGTAASSGGVQSTLSLIGNITFPGPGSIQSVCATGNSDEDGVPAATSTN